MHNAKGKWWGNAIRVLDPRHRGGGGGLGCVEAEKCEQGKNARHLFNYKCLRYCNEPCNNHEH